MDKKSTKQQYEPVPGSAAEVVADLFKNSESREKICIFDIKSKNSRTWEFMKATPFLLTERRFQKPAILSW